jgi:hypothetical protein
MVGEEEKKERTRDSEGKEIDTEQEPTKRTATSVKMDA